MFTELLGLFVPKFMFTITSQGNTTPVIFPVGNASGPRLAVEEKSIN